MKIKNYDPANLIQDLEKEHTAKNCLGAGSLIAVLLQLPPETPVYLATGETDQFSPLLCVTSGKIQVKQKGRNVTVDTVFFMDYQAGMINAKLDQ